MKLLSKKNSDGKLSIQEVPIPRLKKGFVLVKNVYSSLSLGTEKASIQIAKKNLIEKSRERPDDLKKVIELMEKVGIIKAYEMAMSKLELPSPLGYSSAGIVIKTSSEIRSLKVGDRVACGGSGHAEIISVPENLCVKLNENVRFEDAAFVTLSSIALQGIRQAGVSMGDYVAVIGMGLIGLITMKLLRASGCVPVGVDIDDKSIRLSNKLGFKSFNSKESSAILKLKECTKQGGFDNAIITASTKSKDPLDLATEILIDRGKITVVGDLPIEVSRSKFYDKELSLNLSRSYGAGRYDSDYEVKGFDYPIGYVKWTEKRNMKAIIDMLSSGSLSFQDFSPLIVEFENCIEIYNQLEKGNNNWSAALIKYNKIDDVNVVRTKVLARREKNSKKLGVGIIGSGSYAQNVLLPNLSSIKDYDLIGICSNEGSMINHIGRKYNFKYITTKPQKLFQDTEIDIIFILTRHDSHSSLINEALQNGKNVFTEKPLAITKHELKVVEDTYNLSNKILSIGFNRRFSPSIIYSKKHLTNRESPLYINYNINSGKLSPSHWLQDPEIGGGRLVGEGCHFLDLCNFLVEDLPSDISVKYLDNNDLNPKDDSFVISVYYPDGSIAIISYISNSSPKLPKEKIEINFDGSTLIIDDFKSLKYFDGKNKQIKKERIQDKGQKAMLEKLATSLFTDKEHIPVQQIFSVSSMTIDLRDNN